MPAPFFRDAHLKIDRANKHIAEFKSTAIAQKDTYTSTIEHDPNGMQLLVYEFPNFENALCDLAVILGDAVHNLHTALDFAWYSTISEHLPDKISDSTKFPVRETRQALEAALHGIEIDTRCKFLFDLIVSNIQPYKGGHNSAIWILHNLDIFDKHLWLLDLDPMAHVHGVTIRDESGHINRQAPLVVPGKDGRYTIRLPREVQVQDKGKLSVTVTLQEAGIYKPVSVLALLESFSNFVVHTVRRLQNL